MKTHLKTNSSPHKPNPNPTHSSTTRFAVVAFLTLSSAIALPSCGEPPPNATRSFASPSLASPSSRENELAASAPPPPPAPEPAAGGSTTAGVPKKVAETPATRPQLIKKAELSVVVKSIDASSKSVTNIVEKQQGDILGFQNQKPPDSSVRQTASVEIRVPQERLETTL